MSVKSGCVHIHLSGRMSPAISRLTPKSPTRAAKAARNRFFGSSVWVLRGREVVRHPLRNFVGVDRAAYDRSLAEMCRQLVLSWDPDRRAIPILGACALRDCFADVLHTSTSHVKASHPLRRIARGPGRGSPKVGQNNFSSAAVDGFPARTGGMCAWCHLRHRTARVG